MKTTPSPAVIDLVIPLALHDQLLSWLPFYSNSISTIIVPYSTLSKTVKNALTTFTKCGSALGLKSRLSRRGVCYIQEPFIKTGFWDNRNNAVPLHQLRSGWFFVQTNSRIKYVYPSCKCCSTNGPSSHIKHQVRKVAPEIISDYLFPASEMLYDKSRYKFDIKSVQIKSASEVTEKEAELFGLPPSVRVGDSLSFSSSFEEMNSLQTFQSIMKQMGVLDSDQVLVLDVQQLLKK